MTDIDAGSFRGARPTEGAVALLAALALMMLPAVLAIVDSDVLSLQQDGGLLGSRINRFAALQTIGMVVPLVLGLLAMVRNRGRDFGLLAVLVALLGNFLLLRLVLGLVVRAVLL